MRLVCLTGVDGKLVHNRTGHRSDGLLKYEKLEERVVSNVSAILGPKSTSKVQAEPKDKVTINEQEFHLQRNSSFCFGEFNN